MAEFTGLIYVGVVHVAKFTVLIKKIFNRIITSETSSE
jgi:hypothetical protein